MLSMSYTVRSADEEIAEALAWHLEPFRTPHPGPSSFPVDIYVQEEDRTETPQPISFHLASNYRFRSAHPESVLLWALWDLHASVPKRVRDFLFLHAGAVVRNDRALLLPAGMDAGKSSLVIALLEIGFDYLSDEFGALDPVTLRAYPLHKHIKLDPNGLRMLPGLEDRLNDRQGLSARLKERFVRTGDLGAGMAGPALPRWLVFPTPDWDGSPRLERIGPAHAVEEMAAACFNLHLYGDRGVVMLSRIAKDAESFRLYGGTPRERAALLAEELLA
jgi:hypothetical protein